MKKHVVWLLSVLIFHLVFQGCRILFDTGHYFWMGFLVCVWHDHWAKFNWLLRHIFLKEETSDVK